MDVSVIIPFYNNINWLYDAVNSINETKNISFEVIIVNDGSNEEIDLSKFDKNRNKIKVFNQINQGAGKARNFGMEQSIGEYIAFLDSDDLFIKDKLYKQINFMKKNNLSWSHTSYIKFYDNETEQLIDNSYYHGMIFPNCFAFNPIATPTIMIKKEALKNPIKQFSEKMKFGEDGFMWSQLAAYFPVGVIKEPLTRVRMRGTNATLKVINHLYTKSEMYSYMKQSQKYYNGKKIPLFLRTLFAISNFNYKIVKLIFSKNMNSPFAEMLSRLLYSSQYIALRVYKIKSKKNKIDNRFRS